jgi:hypothetical protein
MMERGSYTGDFHPISSRPCRAYTNHCTGRQKAGACEFNVESWIEKGDSEIIEFSFENEKQFLYGESARNFLKVLSRHSYRHSIMKKALTAKSGAGGILRDSVALSSTRSFAAS